MSAGSRVIEQENDLLSEHLDDRAAVSACGPESR
jgi:hypothetical protein